jgi:hypothetical protein
MSQKNPIVITTINEITKGIEGFGSLTNSFCIIIGDLKSPPPKKYQYEDIEFISHSSQNELNFKLTEYLPDNHYSRKNIGYLLAIEKGHNVIAESDDDNIPYEWWENMYDFQERQVFRTVTEPNAINVYKLFSDINIWPRGFPLQELANQDEIKFKEKEASNVLIWQGLADKNPDVDAIFRLVFPDKEVNFAKGKLPVLLNEHVYCPFNSQNTVWSYPAFPYLYLPMFVRFRFTDILRSYIAQRGIWALNGRLAFGSASVYQDRNYHDLLEDFKDEIDCYLEAKNLINILDECKLSGKPCEDLLVMYKQLHEHDIVVAEELQSVQTWISDLKNLEFSI